MLGVKIPLFGKIMLWFFLNLIVLAAIFLLIFRLDVRVDPGSRFFGSRLETVSRLITGEIDELTREQRDEVLARYSEAYKVDFFLFDANGVQLGGSPIELPEKVREEVTLPEGGPPGAERDAAMRGPGRLPPPPSGHGTAIRTSDPAAYWMVMRTMIFNTGDPSPVRSRLIVRSDSFFGSGLFFDPRPWIAVCVVLLVSILFWLPFVRKITNSVGQMTAAAKRLADEDFSVRVDDRGTDELGNLGSSINDLAWRLSGFVQGQKRFLGDISHELNSPLARMQFALSILEDNAREQDLGHITDVKEEVELMSKLVRELLSYSKSGIQGAAVTLEPVRLADIVELVIDRESNLSHAEIRVTLDKTCRVMAQPELLYRAIANVVRNSLDHAGDNAEVEISAHREDRLVALTIRDNGPGVPEEMLGKIFDPLFRVQDDRARQSGGTGLGLAIVKTCINACEGSVTAKNIPPSGLETAIKLKSAD